MPLKLKSTTLSYLLNLMTDALLLIASLLIMYYAKRGHIAIEPNILIVLPFYVGVWFLSTIVTRKFRVNEAGDYIQLIRPFVASILLQLGSLSIILYAFKWIDLSRFIVLGSVALFFIFELALLSFRYLHPFLAKKQKFSEYPQTIFFFLIEFCLITSAFLALYFYKRGSLTLTDDYKSLFLIISFSWMFIGIVIHRFRIPRDHRYIRVVWPFIKSFLVQLAFLSFFVFAFRISDYSRLMIFGTMVLFSFFELSIITIYHLYTKPQKTDEPAIDFLQANLLKEPDDEIFCEIERLLSEKYALENLQSDTISIRRKLKNIYLKNFPEIYDFLNEVLVLENIDINTAEIISSSNPYNAEILPNDSLSFFMNIHEVNDFRRINHYFIEVNKKLKQGGVFVGRFEPYTKRRQRFLKSYPYYLANFLYLFDFIWRRIFPKLPFLQKIYFAFSKGKKRVLSMAEGLGRLSYCGFDIIALREVENFVYFAVSKIKEPSRDPNPSYSPVFKMERVGKAGNPIYVYKFRTMHPYSEYLQDFVLKVNGYSEIGKPADDFRVTPWGKFLRKYWLDELPQVINVLKGEMRLVGVRPISKRFLSEFPEDIQKLRMKHKPSCIPAYVALLKQSKEGFIEAETTYILEKEKHPIMTDVKYFYMAAYNILTNKIRSA